jgi:hypothetical protein
MALSYAEKTVNAHITLSQHQLSMRRHQVADPRNLARVLDLARAVLRQPALQRPEVRGTQATTLLAIRVAVLTQRVLLGVVVVEEELSRLRRLLRDLCAPPIVSLQAAPRR